VGELARRTGLTIRTLHHYDEIGLVRPSLHTEAGHRLYAASDVARLQQVLSLRHLGLSLEEIRCCLDGPSFSPLELIRRHVARLREQIELQEGLCVRLESLAERLNTAEEVSADEFLQTIEAMTMVENYYSPEQLEYLKKRREIVGEERMRQVPAEWAELHALVRAEMEKGTDPADPALQALVQRWRGLINEFTGGDSGIQESLNRLWKEQGPNLAAQHGMNYDPREFEFMRKAMAAGKKTS
jgi:DNA-binding transcriptional MerR regulator